MYWEYMKVTVRPARKEDLFQLDLLLQHDNWEPYAVTWDGQVFDHHLRRKTYHNKDLF